MRQTPRQARGWIGRVATSMNSSLRDKRGFTIVELLIVIVIIGILAAITIVAYNGIQDRAKYTTIQSDLKTIQKVIELHKAEVGTYPSTGGNWSYSSSGANTFVPGVVPKYAASLPQLSGIVTSGNCYIYKSDGTRYKLLRLGQPKLPQYEQDTIPASVKDSTYTTWQDRWGYWTEGDQAY